MSRDDVVLKTYERLIEALAADLLDATAEEILATHAPAAGRVAADKVRQRLRRAAAEDRAAPAAPRFPTGAAASIRRPEKKA